MNRKQRAWLGLFSVVALLAVAAASAVMFFSKDKPPTEEQCRTILNDIERTIKVPGANPRYTLPKSVAHLSSDGLANVVVTPDGRIVALLKITSRWRTNYDGWVICNAPLKTQELSKDSYGRKIILVPSLDSVEPVIKSKHSETMYEVFFDLD